MRLELPVPPDSYKSGSQRARVVTEPWVEENLYCPNCPSPSLKLLDKNTPAIDFACPQCQALFQLKSQKRPFVSRITDAAYSTMVAAIRNDRTPNLFALHYDLETWRVRNLTLIPWFAFSLPAIEKRHPLTDSAERAGWVGCNILLDAIPPKARIPVISDGIPCDPDSVRASFARLKPLLKSKATVRGWRLHVLNVVESLGKEEFTLPEVYAFQTELGARYPANRFVQPKIRQQLQELRNLGFLDFLGRGRYRLR